MGWLKICWYRCCFGALTAGVGAGVGSLIAGGSFGAGFIGSAAAQAATSSFINGALIGASGGLSGGFVGGTLNGLAGDQNFGEALGSGVYAGVGGAVSGGITGGITGGLMAVSNNRNFWNGSRQAEGASPFSFRNDNLLRAQGWSQNPVTGRWYRVIVGDVNGSIPSSGTSNALPPASLDRGSFDAGISRIKTRFITTSNGVTTDLQPTLNRINNGGSFPHRNDGSIFRNDQGRLPIQSENYYHEYVHPTPGVSGPGAMRVVTGLNGQVWFTPDHYRTFIPIR